MLKMALLGLPVGLLLGYSLQRGGFCMNSAFRQIAFERDSRLFKAYGIALLIQMAVLLLLGGVLEIDPAAPPVWWLAATVGGFVFGMGMVLARGCTSGNFYRLGEGLIGAYVVVGVFVLSILVTEVGLLAPLKRTLRAPQLDVPRTLDGWLGVHGVWILLPLAAGLAYWIWRAPPGQASDGRWHWMKTGFVVGLVAAIAWIASSMTGREYGLGPVAGAGRRRVSQLERFHAARPALGRRPRGEAGRALPMEAALSHANPAADGRRGDDGGGGLHRGRL